MTKSIPLTNGLYAVVDDDDFESLSRYKWHTMKVHKNHVYASTVINGKENYMHRMVTNSPSGMVVDHVDGNGLNNTRGNLRVCTFAENLRNAKLSDRNSSGYKGVSRAGKKYKATLQKINIGYFSTPEEAAKAYNVEAKKQFGEFARLNVIKGQQS